jgi:regulatory protein YycH of two-component signal transduction system YycFG
MTDIDTILEARQIIETLVNPDHRILPELQRLAETWHISEEKIRKMDDVISHPKIIKEYYDKKYYIHDKELMKIAQQCLHYIIEYKRAVSRLNKQINPKVVKWLDSQGIKIPLPLYHEESEICG